MVAYLEKKSHEDHVKRPLLDLCDFQKTLSSCISIKTKESLRKSDQGDCILGTDAATWQEKGPSKKQPKTSLYCA